MGETSIGGGPNRGGNENHDNDPRNKTLGEHAPQREPPAGTELPEAVPDEQPQSQPGELPPD